MDFDSTDWPSDIQDQATLLRLDEAASCAICHGPYSIPLALPCGHSFCAECIRSNLEFQERSAPARCPQCRERCDSRQLHPNKALEGVSTAYTAARLLLTQLAKNGALKAAQRLKKQPGYQTRSKQVSKVRQGHNAASAGKQKPAPVAKRKQPDTSSSSAEQAGSQTSSSQESLESDYRPSQRAPSVLSEGGSDVEDPDDGVEPLSKRHKPDAESNKQLVTAAAAGRQRTSDGGAAYLTCPNCSASVPSAVINDHLDRCLESAAANGTTSAAAGAAAKKGHIANARPSGQLQVPPKLAMSLLKDKDLKQKLRQYSLPITGKRQELEVRYGRFRVAVQTALDKGEAGVGYADIARRLVSRDKQAATASLPSHVMPKSARPGPSDSGSGFNELIQATKARRGGPAPLVHDLTADDDASHAQSPAKARSAPPEPQAAAQAGEPLTHSQSLPAEPTSRDAGVLAQPAANGHHRDLPSSNGSVRVTQSLPDPSKASGLAPAQGQSKDREGMDEEYSIGMYDCDIVAESNVEVD